jgi:Cu+-exporting ATPase
VHVSFNGQVLGRFQFKNHYRRSIGPLAEQLKANHKLSVISGDNHSERKNLQELLGRDTAILFHQKPEDKLHFIQELQRSGNKVMMIGDGLNDAGALKQSNVGIAVAEQTNNFTPASDAIIEAKQLPKLDRFISLCRANKNIVIASFVLSIVYNIIGLSFAVRGTLSPLIAAVLMPSSSLSIVLITFGSSNLLARWMKL